MITETLEPEQKKLLEDEIMPLIVKTREITVMTKDEREAVVVSVKKARELKERIEERFHPTANKKTAYSAYEMALETEKAFYVPIDEFVATGTKAVKAFDTLESIRIQREAQEAAAKAKREEDERQAKIQAKIDEENRKIEEARREEERKRAEKENEILRARSKERQEQLRREEEERRAKQSAIDAENARKAEAKKESLQEKAETPQVNFTPPPEPTKKLIWKARVTNLFMLCKAIASGQVPFSVVEVRVSALNDFAKLYDGKTKIEGLEFYQEADSRIR